MEGKDKTILGIGTGLMIGHIFGASLEGADPARAAISTMLFTAFALAISYVWPKAGLGFMWLAALGFLLRDGERILKELGKL